MQKQSQQRGRESPSNEAQNKCMPGNKEMAQREHLFFFERGLHSNSQVETRTSKVRNCALAKLSLCNLLEQLKVNKVTARAQTDRSYNGEQEL